MTEADLPFGLRGPTLKSLILTDARAGKNGTTEPVNYVSFQ
jgi:hypothetical protein